ncbi:MAG: serine/threonine protein kinase, partial [Bacteroidetes bacterium]|nr:serine/threonine protein kinase [Bacteroidota bacterium]
MIGQTISHYRITEELGKGGMGVVYKAVDEKLDRTVALKFLPPHLASDPESKARFIQEAKAASSLDHQNICTIHEIGETDDGLIFIAMACYEGCTIRKEIARGALSVEKAVNYTIQTAEGLATAHQAGIVHRDIKPGNLIVTERDVVKILDFGLAKVTDLSLSATGKRYGTIRYMSPEQARGERVDICTDIWSVGAVLYEMLTGIRPFDAPYETAILYAIINVEPIPLREHDPDIPKALEDIVLRCLAKDPADRYPSSSELVTDLRRLQGGAQAVAATGYRAIMARRRILRRVSVIGVTVLTVLSLFFAIPSLRYTLFPGSKRVPDLRGLAVVPFL